MSTESKIGDVYRCDQNSVFQNCSNIRVERVKGVAKTLIFSLWLAHISHSSLWYLCILPRDWYYIQKGSKLLMCTLISLLKQHFLLLINFCIYFERCSNFEFEAVWIFYVIVFQCKWVSGVDTYEAEIAADSIIWELFARKSTECLNLRNSFITISRFLYFKHWDFILN